MRVRVDESRQCEPPREDVRAVDRCRRESTRRDPELPLLALGEQKVREPE